MLFLGLSSLAEMTLQTQKFSLLISLCSNIYHVDVHIIRKGGRHRVIEGGKGERERGGNYSEKITHGL